MLFICFESYPAHYFRFCCQVSIVAASVCLYAVLYERIELHQVLYSFNRRSVRIFLCTYVRARNICAQEIYVRARYICAVTRSCILGVCALFAKPRWSLRSNPILSRPSGLFWHRQSSGMNAWTLVFCYWLVLVSMSHVVLIDCRDSAFVIPPSRIVLRLVSAVWSWPESSSSNVIAAPGVAEPLRRSVFSFADLFLVKSSLKLALLLRNLDIWIRISLFHLKTMNR